MTAIDFYTRVGDRLQVAVRIAAKAFAQRSPVRVLTADASMTEALDRALWVQPAISFLPHCRLDDRLAGETSIWVDHRLEHAGTASVLINLHPEPPPFFARFERLAEIVDEESAAAARQRYRYYRERGYELRTHDLGAS
jgi:DNA polymerase-3 subunit chi